VTVIIVIIVVVGGDLFFVIAIFVAGTLAVIVFFGRGFLFRCRQAAAVAA
jgi:hypothetical protein